MLAIAGLASLAAEGLDGSPAIKKVYHPCFYCGDVDGHEKADDCPLVVQAS